MKIYTDGARASWCQLPRIEKAFRILGHEIIEDISQADLIYVNNAWYDSVIRAKEDGKVGGKIIFNVLDCAKHIPDFPVEKLKVQLSYADYVTTISEYVKNDLFNRFQVDAQVIYQPIMPVDFREQKISSDTLSSHRLWDFLAVGRIADPNKRMQVAVQALNYLNKSPDCVAVVGNEYFGWGQNQGLVDNETLAKLYNSAKFVFCLGKEEGICLPMIEAMAAGAIPIVCNDLSTRTEFLPPDLFPEYEFVHPNALSVAAFISQFDNTEKYNKMVDRLKYHYRNELSLKFNPMVIAANIIKIYGGVHVK